MTAVVAADTAGAEVPAASSPKDCIGNNGRYQIQEIPLKAPLEYLEAGMELQVGLSKKTHIWQSLLTVCPAIRDGRWTPALGFQQGPTAGRWNTSHTGLAMSAAHLPASSRRKTLCRLWQYDPLRKPSRASSSFVPSLNASVLYKLN